MADLSQLTTETRNHRSEQIDTLSTIEMLALINDEDATVAAAVRGELPQIARAIDAIVSRFEAGGRLVYIGAGTSGRLGVLDASECPPTFSVAPTLVQGIIAGGDTALRRSSERSEDSRQEGARDLEAADFSEPDILVGIAASGRTPYVLGAMSYARQQRALTIALACVPDSKLAGLADIAITPVTGPEVLTGSTRMKAGTATKLVLNMLSTGVMIRSGASFGNLMVNVQPTNAKLVDRARRIIMSVTGCDAPTSARLLAETGHVKTAIVMHLLSVDAATAGARLEQAHGSLRAALKR